jgi:hypothetical protein
MVPASWFGMLPRAAIVPASSLCGESQNVIRAWSHFAPYFEENNGLCIYRPNCTQSSTRTPSWRRRLHTRSAWVQRSSGRTPTRLSTWRSLTLRPSSKETNSSLAVTYVVPTMIQCTTLQPNRRNPTVATQPSQPNRRNPTVATQPSQPNHTSSECTLRVTTWLQWRCHGAVVATWLQCWTTW